MTTLYASVISASLKKSVRCTQMPACPGRLQARAQAINNIVLPMEEP